LLDQFASEGLALVRLDSTEAGRLADLHHEAKAFFALAPLLVPGEGFFIRA